MKMLGWTSKIPPVWIWHAMFDGTVLCRCEHSEYMKRLAARRRVGSKR